MIGSAASSLLMSLALSAAQAAAPPSAACPSLATEPAYNLDDSQVAYRLDDAVQDLVQEKLQADAKPFLDEVGKSIYKSFPGRRQEVMDVLYYEFNMAISPIFKEASHSVVQSWLEDLTKKETITLVGLIETPALRGAIIEIMSGHVASHKPANALDCAHTILNKYPFITKLDLQVDQPEDSTLENISHVIVCYVFKRLRQNGFNISDQSVNDACKSRI